jgi:alpha-tubulin suppressor-like RCC1 family protein
MARMRAIAFRSTATLGALLLAAAPGALAAQTIGVTLGDSARVVAPPGTSLSVPLRADLTLSAGVSLASLQTRLRWPATRLRFDSLRAPTGWTATINQDSAATGALVVSTFSATALAASGPVATAFFTATANSGGARVTLTPTDAGAEDGQSVLPFLQARNLDVCVGVLGKWGDVTDDATVNIIDAQQIARFSVGLSVANAAVLAQRGDVTGDNAINVLDAQQIARFSVALSANARISTMVFSVPTPASVAMITPAATEVTVGRALQLSAEPRDGSGASLAGCPVVTWGSDAPTVATVSASGLVTGVGPGVVTLTATSGGQSASTSLTIRALVANGPPVAVGSTHTCALSSEGQAHCWGLNSNYQLGDGTNEERLSPVPVSGAVRFVALTGGRSLNFTCGLDASGTAWCWGSNSSGQLGDGTTVSRAVPTRVFTDRRFTQLTAGGSHACGIATDGDSYCWGSNASGQLGGNSTATATTPTRVQSAVRFARIGAGGNHTCAQQVTGEAWCWGSNSSGQLGNGTTTASPSPLPVQVSTTQRFVALTSGSGHSCGLTTAGTAYCWGSNVSGQLGDGTTASTSTPVAVLGGPFAAISAGTAHSCATTGSGSTTCWGWNSSGQLGDGSQTNRLTPTTVSGSLTFLAVYPSNVHSCGMLTTGALQCWGNNTNGQLGDGTRSNLVAPTPIAGTIAFAQLQGASSASCGVNATGTAFCWGSNTNGRLGIASDDASSRTTPVAVAGGLTFSAVSANAVAGSFCGLSTGSGAAYCWGSNFAGGLGDGTTTDRVAPVQVVGGGSYRVLATGGYHSCALTTANALRCWGYNLKGQLGDGTTTNQSVPTAVNTTQAFVNVATGGSHSCGLTASGSISCWGYNLYGQLGDGSTTDRSAPTPVSGGLTFSAVSTGWNHSCALTTAAALYCWGWNTSGQLGDGTTTDRSVPTLIANGPFASVALGQSHTCARSTTGSTSCWGLNSSGQLGDGTITNRLTPTPVIGGLAFASITAGSSHTCGVTAAGVGYCWGQTSSGQTGVDLPLPIPRPVITPVTFRRP